MPDAYYVGAYWGPRRESAADCAVRLSGFMALLANVHPLLSSWYKTGWSRQAALAHRIDPSVETLQELLLAGQNRGDDEERTVIADLGFSVGLWNGQEPEVGLTAHCGSWTAVPGLTPNSVVLDLPGAQGTGLALYDRETALRLIHAIVTTWQPSWCTYTSHQLRRAQGRNPDEVAVGWATYVANYDGARTHTLPAGVTAEPLEGGLLMTVDGDATSLSESSVIAVRSALGSALRWRPFPKSCGTKRLSWG